MRPYRFITLIALFAAVAALVTGCGSSSKSDTDSKTTAKAPAGNATVNVKLGEMYISPDIVTVPAGKVSFNVTNDGKVLHEMVILKSDTPADKLTVDAARVDESSSVGEVADIAAKESKSGSFDLKPGKYILVCNLPGHYAGGMYAAFTVSPAAAKPVKSDGDADKAAAAAAAAAAAKVDTTVNATLGEMYLKLDKATVPAGTIKFDVTNKGNVMHEMVMLKTDTPAGKLVATNGRVDEADSVGEVADVEAHGTKSGTFTLKPGKYAFVCNIAGHYPAGMWAQFTVT